MFGPQHEAVGSRAGEGRRGADLVAGGAQFFNGYFAVAGSLLYTFLPYHLMRGELHLETCFYFLIPLAVYICLQIFDFDFTLQSIKSRKGLFFIVVAILLGITFEYYAFYACFLFMAAGVIASISIARWMRQTAGL